ncbi:MAG: hypothetical protein FWD76_06035, partial [Firmicutes bacterium]|nr:hypothetical protein [Bacillota bacterium]
MGYINDFFGQNKFADKAKSFWDFITGRSFWHEWVHGGDAKKAHTINKKKKNVELGLSKEHCPICLNLHGCWFVGSKSPIQPLHKYCHCAFVKIPTPVGGFGVIAQCDRRKFVEYIFNPDSAKGEPKGDFFRRHGYTIDDVDYMMGEYERQAIQIYGSGEYALGKLDAFGQRIDMWFTLPNRK